MQSFLLSSFSLMALIIIIVALLFFIVIKQSPHQAVYKEWLLIYFLGLMIWHGMGFLSGGLHTQWRELTYRITNSLFNMGLAITCIGFVQVAYLFPDKAFEKERKLVLRISLVVTVAYLLTIVWYHFLSHNGAGSSPNGYGAFVNPLAGLYTLLLDGWVVVVFLRKAAHFRKMGRTAVAYPSRLLGLMLMVFIFISLMFIYPGGDHPMVLPIYIYGLWVMLQVQCILFIIYSSFPVSFQTKMLGFTLAVVMAILSITIMAIVPFTTNADTAVNLAQRVHDQETLIKLCIVIVLSAAFIIGVFPIILRKNMVQPLGRLVEGMKRADEGDLSVTVPEGVLDEMGIVSRHFNNMVASLGKYRQEIKHYTETLEQQVQDRTADLQKSLNDLKAAQAQLIQAEKMASLGELTAGIAHEIQNPLNFINNFSELNQELATELMTALADNDAEEATDIAKGIQTNAEKIRSHGMRADGIVKGMLQHARTTAGQSAPTDINALCDEYLRLAYHGLRAKDKNFNTALVTSFADDIGELTIVGQDIGRVVLNLVNNAFYAVRQRTDKEQGNGYEPEVKFTTAKQDQTVTITVEDNGSGIDEVIMDKIFQPFFTTKPTGQGTGLGLSLSYDIVKAHGGLLQAENRKEGGARFTINLPVSGGGL